MSDVYFRKEFVPCPKMSISVLYSLLYTHTCTASYIWNCGTFELWIKNERNDESGLHSAGFFFGGGGAYSVYFGNESIICV